MTTFPCRSLFHLNLIGKSTLLPCLELSEFTCTFFLLLDSFPIRCCILHSFFIFSSTISIYIHILLYLYHPLSIFAFVVQKPNRLWFLLRSDCHVPRAVCASRVFLRVVALLVLDALEFHTLGNHLLGHSLGFLCELTFIHTIRLLVMGQFDYYSSSPVIACPPQPVHYLVNYPISTMNPESSRAFALPSPVDPVMPSTPRTASLPATPLSRKRSREVSDLEEDDYFTTSYQFKTEEKGFGNSTTTSVISPYTFQADNGAWKEESVPMTPPADRPILRSNKSQRLDLTATPVISEEISLANGMLVAPSPPKTSTEPTVDDFTIYLGIGWSMISKEDHIQAAARGWAKFIEHRYPLTNVEIKLESRGLASYLVEAKEGWYLFSEDLMSGRLVARNLERCFENLRTVPPTFDSQEILSAVTQSPAAATSMATGIVQLDGRASHGVMVEERVPDTVHDASSTIDMEMDMS